MIERYAKLYRVTPQELQFGRGEPTRPTAAHAPGRVSESSATLSPFAEHVLFTAGRIAELAEQIRRAAEKQLGLSEDLGRRAQGAPPISVQDAREGDERLRARDVGESTKAG